MHATHCRASVLFLILPLLTLLMTFGQARAAEAGVMTGRVVEIIDGDTVTLLTPGLEQVRIRLAEIDTPEKGQPYGQKAKQALAEMVHREIVRIEVVTIDRYGRTVGKILRLRDRLDVNAEMVRRGHAWVYRKYSDDPMMLEYEEAARQGRRGLWYLPAGERTAPWEWRRQSFLLEWNVARAA